MPTPDATDGEGTANSAHALHRLLTQIAVSPQPAATAWTSALEARYGTPEFARKHTEVVGLLLDTIRSIGSLPDGPASRQMTYVPAWWAAVLAPELHWRVPGEPASRSINQSDLNHLADLGDLLNALLPGTTTAPTGNPDLTALAEQAQEWLTLLRTTHDIADPIRQVLTGQIRHLLWLIQHADLFGTAHAAQHAEAVTGALTQAGNTITEPAARDVWQRRAARFATALSMTVMTLAAAPPAIETVQAVADELRSTVTAEIEHPARQRPPAQLPPGQAGPPG